MVTFDSFDSGKEIEKVKKAFGGCEKCYGKGYSTVTVDGTVKVNTCVCDRGKQMDELMEIVHAGSNRTLIDEMIKVLPGYIDEKYPKGKAKDRGAATVHISEFLLEAKKAL